MSKNNILIIGDGMGWEMTRSSAIYNQVDKEITTLKTAGKTDLEIKSLQKNQPTGQFSTAMS